MIVDDEQQNQVQILFDVTVFGGFLQNKLKILCPIVNYSHSK